MSTMKLKTGVVGLGMGCGHAAAYKALPNAELTAICDTNEQWLKHCQKEWDVPNAYASTADMFASSDLDAVSIAVPTYLHKPIAIAALEAGKHVLIEKPMAMTAAEGAEMAAAAKANGKLLMVSYNQRFTPDVVYLKNYIDAGHLGDIYFVRTLWRRPLGCLPAPLVDRVTGTYERNWFNDAEKGGGAVRDLGSHMIDVAMWLMGFPELESATGCAYTKFLPEYLSGLDVASSADDHGVGFAKFKNGASMQIEASYGQHWDKEEIMTEIFGTKGGVLRTMGQDPKIFSEVDGAYAASSIRVTGPYASVIAKDISAPSCTQAEFVNSILSCKVPMITPEQGVAVMQIIDGIYGVNSR